MKPRSSEKVELRRSPQKAKVQDKVEMTARDSGRLDEDYAEEAISRQRDRNVRPKGENQTSEARSRCRKSVNTLINTLECRGPEIKGRAAELQRVPP
jgi:hypothetical protein